MKQFALFLLIFFSAGVTPCHLIAQQSDDFVELPDSTREKQHSPTKATITGYGSWYRMAFNTTNGVVDSDLFTGIAPLNIKMGEVIYQRSEYLPEFFGL